MFLLSPTDGVLSIMRMKFALFISFGSIFLLSCAHGVGVNAGSGHVILLQYTMPSRLLLGICCNASGRGDATAGDVVGVVEGVVVGVGVSVVVSAGVAVGVMEGVGVVVGVMVGVGVIVSTGVTTGTTTSSWSAVTFFLSEN